MHRAKVDPGRYCTATGPVRGGTQRHGKPNGDPDFALGKPRSDTQRSGTKRALANSYLEQVGGSSPLVVSPFSLDEPMTLDEPMIR